MEQSKNIPIEAEPTSMNEPEERLVMTQAGENFHACTSRELSRILSLHEYQTVPGKTATFLQTIYRDQKGILRKRKDAAVKTGVEVIEFDTMGAVRSVAREFIGYYKSSRTTLMNLGFLAIDLADFTNPAAKIEKTVKVDHIGLAELFRYIDLSRVVSDQADTEGRIASLSKLYVDNPSDEIRAYNEFRASGLNVGQVRETLPLAIEDQKNRNRYWYDRLIEGMLHGAAKPLIEEALIKYDYKQQ